MHSVVVAREPGYQIQAAGQLLLRYSLVLVIAWIGAMKFTAFEAAQIQPLVESSPLLRWMYRFLSVQGVSTLFGIVELTAALMIALRPVSASAAAVGSGAAVMMFLTTLTFLFSLPGWEPTLGGFPALSGAGGFLIKDVVLLSAAVWSLGEALEALAACSVRCAGLRNGPGSWAGRSSSGTRAAWKLISPDEAPVGGAAKLAS